MKRRPSRLAWTRLPLFAALLPLSAALVGCPGTIDDFTPFRGGGACADVPAEIFGKRCATAGCHTGAMPAGSLDLTPSGVETRVVGKPASMDCGGTLVDPMNPKASILYLKLSAAPPCGSPMPLGGATLSAADQQCVLDWITAR
jgi:hypothetical protein